MDFYEPFGSMIFSSLQHKCSASAKVSCIMRIFWEALATYLEVSGLSVIHIMDPLFSIFFDRMCSIKYHFSHSCSK